MLHNISHEQPQQKGAWVETQNEYVLVQQKSVYHSRPKPSAFMIASFSLSVSFSLLLYEGSSRVLKQVCDVGSLLLSVPSR